MAVRALELEVGGYGGEFADIFEADWYAPYFSAARQAGMIEGTGGYANPDALITREEMAKILVSMYEAKKRRNPVAGTVAKLFGRGGRQRLGKALCEESGRCRIDAGDGRRNFRAAG